MMLSLTMITRPNKPQKSLQSEVNKIELNKLRVESAQENFRIINDKFNSEVATSTELSEASTLLAEAKLNMSIPSDIKKIYSIFRKNGKQLYVVGGAVRDLILKQTPKDFDIATSAHPHEIKKLFRNSIIIGRDDDFIKILNKRIELAKKIKSEFLENFQVPNLKAVA